MGTRGEGGTVELLETLTSVKLSHLRQQRIGSSARVSCRGLLVGLDIAYYEPGCAQSWTYKFYL
jgi:hypothetical protein